MYVKSNNTYSNFLLNYYEENNLMDTLNRDQVNELILLAQSGNESSKVKLIGSVIKYIYQLAIKFSKSNVEIEDLLQIGIVGCIKAINTYNINYNYVFLTYASTVIRNEMLSYLRKYKFDKEPLSLNSICDESECEFVELIRDTSLVAYVEELIERKDLIQCISMEIKKFPIRDAEIIEYYFGINGKDVKNQKELSDFFGLSQPHISRIIRRTLKNIKEELNC